MRITTSRGSWSPVRFCELKLVRAIPSVLALPRTRQNHLAAYEFSCLFEKFWYKGNTFFFPISPRFYSSWQFGLYISQFRSQKWVLACVTSPRIRSAAASSRTKAHGNNYSYGPRRLDTRMDIKPSKNVIQCKWRVLC